MQPLDQEIIDYLLNNNRATKEEISEYESLLSARFEKLEYEESEKRLQELYQKFYPK